MLMFAIVFGLSMDYEVFLISRVHEAWIKTADAHRSVAIGIGSTARVITTAAAIMVVVFPSFVLDPDPTVKMLAVGMAAAVLIDACVRMILVPAGDVAAGRHAWWMPRWLDPIVPHLELEGSIEPADATSADAAPTESAPVEPVAAAGTLEARVVREAEAVLKAEPGPPPGRARVRTGPTRRGAGPTHAGVQRLRAGSARLRPAVRGQHNPRGRVARGGSRVNGWCGGRLPGEWHDAAPAERDSAKAFLDAARGTQPHRPTLRTHDPSLLFPGSGLSPGVRFPVRPGSAKMAADMSREQEALAESG